MLSPFRAPRRRPISTSAHNSSAPFLRRPYAWQRLGSTGGHLVLRGNQCQLTTSCPFAWITVRYPQAVWLGDAEPPRRASHGAPQSSSCRSACTLVNPQMLKPGGVFRGGRQRQGYLKKELRNSPPFDTSGEVAIRGKLAHDECSGKAVSDQGRCATSSAATRLRGDGRTADAWGGLVRARCASSRDRASTGCVSSDCVGLARRVAAVRSRRTARGRTDRTTAEAESRTTHAVRRRADQRRRSQRLSQ